MRRVKNKRQYLSSESDHRRLYFLYSNAIHYKRRPKHQPFAIQKLIITIIVIIIFTVLFFILFSIS